MGKEATTEQRRAQILAAAAAVFAGKGFHKARMDDVARAAGLGKGTVYWYFASKEELAISLVEIMQGVIPRQLADAAGEPGSVRERITAQMNRLAESLAANSDTVLLTFEMYSLSYRVPEIRAYFIRFYTELTGQFVRLLEQGVAAGELAEDTDVETVARTLVSAVDGLSARWALAPEDHDLRANLASTVALILDAVTAKAKGE
ncbi:TetR family transcriptional regulator [Lentzea atacamensis]|nr:TetR family transcriptional regulator [Lentzea atacamensis]